MSKQNVDLPNFSKWTIIRKTGEVLIVCPVDKKDGVFLYLYTLQQGESPEKQKVELPCNHHFDDFNLLCMQILWREYLAISCRECKNIKLVDLETLEITTAFSDEQLVGKMCKGWRKIYVEIKSGSVELDCSSTKFSKIRQIETGEDVLKRSADMCYVPSPHNMIVAVNWDLMHKGGWIHAISTDENNRTMWCLSDKEEDGKIIKPGFYRLFLQT